MRTINIKTIEFDTAEEANDNKNYPNNGFFMVIVKNGSNDLRGVNKSEAFNYFIMPEDSFNKLFESEEIANSFIELKTDSEVTETIEVPAKYDGDFILEFARILLNRK